MKKIIVCLLGTSLLLSSCVTTSDGAYTGGTFGTILGSAIGGILGGPRGSDIGTIVGMAGGAAMGAAAGHANEQKAIKDHYQRVQENKAQGYNPYDDTYSNSLTDNSGDSGFDPNNSGDDRLFAFDATTNSEAASEAPNVEIRNVVFEDANRDGVLSRGETGTVVFEVINRGKYPLDNIQPTVQEVTGNKYIAVSPSIRVERIMPGQGIRYTATVKASSRTRNGRASFVPTVCQGTATIGQASSVSVTTRR